MSDLITVELSKPIKFTPANSGEQVEGKFITLREPTSRARELEICAYFKQQFFKAANGLNNQNAGKDKSSQEQKSDIDAQAIIYMLYTSSSTDMPVVMEKAKSLFKIVGKIEDKKNLTDSMLDSLAQDDLDMLLGEYLVNFTLRSILSNR